jgi:hypothetical protein
LVVLGRIEGEFAEEFAGFEVDDSDVGGLPTDAVLNGYLDPPKGMSLSGDASKLIDALVGDLTRLGLPAPDHDALASHPIMNNQVLHHLSHGDLVAKPDVERLTSDGVVFKDGSFEQIDVVLLATGYEYKVPFIADDLLVLKSGHPQLYLNVFSREVDSLYVLGFIEFADAAYKRFDEMAQLVMIDIRARETGRNRDALMELKKADSPDLRGGIAYIDSPRSRELRREPRLSAVPRRDPGPVRMARHPTTTPTTTSVGSLLCCPPTTSRREPVSERGLALVTGAAGGIGLEVACRLADRGYGVIAVGTRRGPRGCRCDLVGRRGSASRVRPLEQGGR